MGLLPVWAPHCRRWVAVPRSHLTAWYMHWETQTVTYPTKRCTLDVQAPIKVSTEAPNLSKDEMCFNFSLNIPI
jgi:hypothetical protein